MTSLRNVASHSGQHKLLMEPPVQCPQTPSDFMKVLQSCVTAQPFAEALPLPDEYGDVSLSPSANDIPAKSTSTKLLPWLKPEYWGYCMEKLVPVSRLSGTSALWILYYFIINNINIIMIIITSTQIPCFTLILTKKDNS